MIIRYLGASIKSIIGRLELCQSHSIKISKWKLSMLGGKLRQRFRVSLLILCKNMENFQFSLSDLTSSLVSMSWFVVESQQDCSVIWKQFTIWCFDIFFLCKPTSFNTIRETDYTTQHISDQTFDHNRNWQSLPTIYRWFAVVDQSCVAVTGCWLPSRDIGCYCCRPRWLSVGY